MKKIKYIKFYNNYELEINKVYEGYNYKKGWINIENVLYRGDCFEELNNGM